MKSRILMSALSLLLVLCLLAGCQTDGTESSVSDVSSVTEGMAESSGESSLDTSSGSTGSGDTSSEIELPPDDPAEEDFFTLHGQSVLPETATRPAVCEPTETEHLYRFPIDLPDADGFTAQSRGEILHLSYWTEESKHCMYSLTTGEQLCELTIPPWNATGILDDGRLWCVNLAVFETVIYNTDGTKTVLTEAQDESAVLPQNVSVSPDGRYLLALYEGNLLVLRNLQDGTEQEIDAGEGAYWGIDAAEGMFYLRYSETGMLSVNCEDGSTERQYVADELGAMYGDLWRYHRDGAVILGGTDEDGKRFYAPLEDIEMLDDIMHGCAATVLRNDDTENYRVRFYDLREGVILSEFDTETDGYGVQTVFLQNGAVLMLQYSENGTELFWYDLPAAAEKGEKIETLLLSESELASEIDRIALETEQATGVDLLYGSDGNDFVLYDYVGAAEMDLYTIYGAVKTVSEILMSYPEGMLRESYAETHRGLQIYLCGTIYGTSDRSLSQAGGVTTDSDGYILVAVDVHDNLKYDIPHELSHVFDRRITHVSSTAERDWMMLWEAATPIENVYAYSYDDYYEYTRYTAWNESNDANVWFVDSYARTFPTEDRARIMENLFNPEADGLAEVFQFENLQAKARLYAYILRECFESCDVDEVLYWETYLGTIDESVIPQ